MRDDDFDVVEEHRGPSASHRRGFLSALRARFRQGTRRDHLGQEPAFRRFIGQIISLLIFFGLWRVLDARFVLPWVASAGLAAVITAIIVKLYRMVCRTDQF